MTDKIVVADPCYTEKNFRALLGVLFRARNDCEDNYEYGLLTRIIFDVLIDMGPFEQLYNEICGKFESGLVEFASSEADLNKLSLYQTTPHRALDILDNKRGYILDSKTFPKEYKLSWKEVKNVLFLDPPDELVDSFSVPGVRWIARWRLGCYEEFLRRENENGQDG
jgi:hypothetical protein